MHYLTRRGSTCKLFSRPDPHKLGADPLDSQRGIPARSTSLSQLQKASVSDTLHPRCNLTLDVRAASTTSSRRQRRTREEQLRSRSASMAFFEAPSRSEWVFVLSKDLY